MKPVFLLLVFSSNAFCFNFDMDFPIVFKEPVSTEERTYFGYTVAMYPGNIFNKQWIRIGAPKGNDTNYPKIEEPGIVYNCEVMVGCTPIHFPHSRERPFEEWKHGWIGGTMDISYAHERLAVCGFRQYYVINGDYRTMGACYWSFLNTSEFQSIKPLLDPGRGTFSYGSVGSVYLYGQGQAGFSAHFTEQGNELIVGAPGTFNWAGTPFKVKDLIYYNPEPSRRRRSTSATRTRRDIEPFKTVEVPDSTKNEAFRLFGYSVTSGYYYGRNVLHYASGSPKGNAYNGKVVVFRFAEPEQLINVDERKIGEDFGEYFGASLASGNINGDTFDDLLVGAPFYKGSSYNEGRVFVFLGAQDKLRKRTIVNGQSKNGQFGTSIMYLGDIDNDGFGDVAISAPYEKENSGAVYIYKGTTDGLLSKPCQTIIGKEISADIMGFGITISKAVDMDQNGFKDITVGAHLSGHAVFFRSRPLVAIKYTFASIPKILPEYTRTFILNVCFSYSLFEEPSVDIQYSVTMDELLGRALIGSNMTMATNLTIYRDKPTCQNINVLILDTPNLDIKIPLQAKLSYSLNYPVVGKSMTLVSDRMLRGDDKLCIRCPVLDVYKSNQTLYEAEIPFTLGCGSDNECHSYLDIDIKFPQLRDDTLVIGSDDYLKMDVTVKNTGENAYSTKLYVVLPNSMYFRQTPPRCKSENASAILCDIANPLRSDTMKAIEFDLDVKTLNQYLYTDHVDIYSKVITTSNNTNDDTQWMPLKLKREADITIYGKTEQETNYYGNSSVSSSLLTHTYKVEKFGDSSLEKLSIKIRVPHTYKVKDEDVKFLGIAPIEALYFDGQPFTCNILGITVETTVDKIVLDENTSARRRRRRQVEVFKDISDGDVNDEIMVDNEEIVVVANKTLYLNCSTRGVKCFEVSCSFGPYDKENTPASITLTMMVNITAIAELSKDKDMVLISATGDVTVDSPKDFIQYEDRPDFVIISSLFLNDSTKPVRVALWIIVLSVIIGLLLLLLLILVLIKMGFFKRSKKEELENLKAAATQEAKILEIIEGSKTPADDELDDPPFEDQELGSSNEDEDDKSKENKLAPHSNSSKEHLCDI